MRHVTEDIMCKTDENGHTLLDWASLMEPHTPLTICEYLLQRTPLDAINNESKSAPTFLHNAAAHGNTDLAMMLLAHGADVNSQDSCGRTPLYEAAMKGNVVMVDFLLDHGAIINARSMRGETPLHYASIRGHAKAARLLLQRGAHVNAINDHGFTPLEYALSHEHKNAACVLLEVGAKLPKKTPPPQPLWDDIMSILACNASVIALLGVYSKRQGTVLHTEGDDGIKCINQDVMGMVAEMVWNTRDDHTLWLGEREKKRVARDF